MRAWRHLGCALAVVFFCSAQLSGCSDDSSSHTCTVIGCGAAVKAWLPYSEPLATLDGTTAEFCRNDEVCFEGLAHFIPSDSNPSLTFSMKSTASGDEATLAGHVIAYSVSADPAVLYFEYAPGDVEDLVDGDLYTIELAGPAPTSFIGNVSAYLVSHPNGPDCEPTCKSFEFDTR